MKQQQIKELLNDLAHEGNQRELKKTKVSGKYITLNDRTYVNLSSNDYLGLTEDNPPAHLGVGGIALQWEFFRQLDQNSPFLMSNPSSRLMSGNTIEYDMLEQALAGLYPGRRRALVFNSGYAANVGALAAMTSDKDLILADKASHASLHDGLRMCQGEWMRFRHNDMDHLESLLSKHRPKYRNAWVVTESVFSMDGDRCPLPQLMELKNKYDLQILLDESHSFGVCGRNGAGYAHELGLADQVDVISASLGKAAVSTGGFLLTDPLTRELMVNRMRTLIFSTALPSLNLLWTYFIISRLPDMEPRRRHLRQLTELLTEPGNGSQIIPIITGSNDTATLMARKFRESGFWLNAIRHPTVPKGRERVRLSLNAALSIEEVEKFKTAWNKISAALSKPKA